MSYNFKWAAADILIFFDESSSNLGTFATSINVSKNFILDELE